MPPALAAAVVLDAAGRSVPLSPHWQAHDALLLWVRHFACAGCAAHVAELRPRLAELAAVEVGVVIIGNGTPAQLAAFAAREALAGYPVALCTDPTRASYAAAGLGQSLLGTVGPRAVVALLGLRARGFANGLPQGDLTQQGGTLYVARGGQIVFAHASARLGDHAPLVDLIDLALARHAGAAELP